MLFIEPVVAHYRRDTFRLILANGIISCAILAGNEYEGVKPATLENSIIGDYLTIRFFNHRFYYLRNALKKARSYKPDAIVCSGIDFHHLHTIAIYIWAKFCGVKFFWWSHATMGNQGKLGFMIRKFFYKNSDGILAYSQAGRLRMLKVGIPAENLVVVGNSLNSEDYGFKIDHKPTPTFTILYSGRITPSKKLHVLVHAMAMVVAKNRNIQCKLVGGGDIKSIENLAAELGIENYFQFLGPIYGKDLIPHFSSSNLFVYPGGIGLSMAHALSYGLPVITTDAMSEHGPEIELLKPGVNGDYFIDGDPESLANTILLWVEKLQINSDYIQQACKETVFQFGYLPEELSKRVIEFLLDKIEKP